MPLVYIADDEPNIRRLVAFGLKDSGFESAEFADGETLLAGIKARKPDVIILDWMMPPPDGLAVCRTLRSDADTRDIPILMLTARGEEIDKVLGLELGADDYIVKPFETKELIARIRAVLRRSSADTKENPEILTFPGLEINIANYELKVDGKTIDTPARELELLYFLASNKNVVFTREQLLEKVWGFEYGGESRTIDVHVKRLREKLGNTHDKYWMLKTKHCVGYIFEVYEQ